VYTLVLRHLSRVHLSRANFLYSHDLSDAQLTWNKVYRICKSSSVVTEFIHDVKLLIDKLITQNFERKILHRYFKVFIKSQPVCILRHWHSFTVNDFMLL